MKIKIRHHTSDYREAQELFAKFKQQAGKVYQIYDYQSKMYTVEFEAECKTEAEQHRLILQQMWLNSDVAEEEDALAYADAAIKTLIDMGVIQ